MKAEEEKVLLMAKIRRLLLSTQITDWEKDFLKSVLEQLEHDKTLTVKQQSVLNKIVKQKRS